MWGSLHQATGRVLSLKKSCLKPRNLNCYKEWTWSFFSWLNSEKRSQSWVKWTTNFMRRNLKCLLTLFFGDPIGRRQSEAPKFCRAFWPSRAEGWGTTCWVCICSHSGLACRHEFLLRALLLTHPLLKPSAADQTPSQKWANKQTWKSSARNNNKIAFVALFFFMVIWCTKSSTVKVKRGARCSPVALNLTPSLFSFGRLFACRFA